MSANRDFETPHARPPAHVSAELRFHTRLGLATTRRALLPLLRELGIGFVPYSPLGHGFLTGTIRSPEDLADNDWRKNNPRGSHVRFGRLPFGHGAGHLQRRSSAGLAFLLGRRR
jgi:aryl-alcohol dehydrogenase-like predicted oxidoreductase